MASTKDKTSASKKGVFSPLFRPVGMLFSLFLYLTIVLLINILVEWIGITFWWPTDHASVVLVQELQHLGENFSTSIVGLSPAEFAAGVAITIKSWLTQNAFVQWLLMISMQPQSNVALHVIAQLIQLMAVYTEAALFVCMTVGARLTIIILSSTAIILVAIITAIDGLIERELRAYGGDGEHSRIVHWALEYSPLLALIAPAIYLSWPTVANPAYFFIPAMLCYGFANFVLFSKYQKRL